ncbi:hypothetical protein EUX98_g221 [Antrodiella citrinella]|uniref:Major facilitator superfamily (MFS) profile domain-containing protein n=1 Tax=Antrodiella citrinella TaxID=2447956 RepID=A0A4S4N7L0_9APHY|nr:hypothetical protein EUX98_g221 [Antrodiella citrinella]
MASQAAIASSSSSPVQEQFVPFLDAQDLEQAIKLDPLYRDEDDSVRATTTTITPVPKAQLASLCAVRLVDPVAFTQIFPYVNEMMDWLHVTEDRSRIGFYSGMVESIFAISQLLSIYQWAKFSDRVGRRPVVLIGILGIALSTLLTGLSKSFFAVLLARCLGGLFSGNIAVIHSVLGELTDATNQAIAFPIYGLCWPLGSIVGPLIGGTLSNAADKFPQWFDIEIFRLYPYLLPCLISAALAFVGALAGYFCLEETLPSKRKGGVSKGHSEKPQEAASIQYLWSIPVVRALCLSGCFLSFINTAFDVTFVLFCYSAISAGGLAFSASEIGYSLAISGSASGCLQLFFMPYLLRRFDPAKMYNLCMAIWPYCYIFLPGLNLIAKSGTIDEAGQVDPATKAFLWMGIGGVLLLARSAGLSFSVSMILVKDAAPDPSSLGATNGLAQFAMCFARAFAPAFASSLFAVSAGSTFFPIRYAWVAILAGISMFGTRFSRKIEEGRKLQIPRR